MQTKILTCLCIFSFSLLLAQKNEEAAIRNTIEEETHAINKECNYEKWADNWWHEDYCYFSVTWPGGHWGFYGWDQINEWAKNAFKSCLPRSDEQFNAGFKKYDYNIKINGNMAFVTFQEGDGRAESTRVLEKRNGKWKLVRMGVIHTHLFKQKEEEQKLAQFEGKWRANMSSLKVKQPNPEGNVSGIDLTCGQENNEMIIELTVYYFNETSGPFSYQQKMHIARDTETKKLTHYAVGKWSNGWTNVFLGSAEMKDNKSLELITFKKNDTEKRNGRIIYSINNNRPHLDVENYGENGEVEFQFSVDLEK